MCTPWKTKRSGVVLERQDALAAQDVGAVDGDQILHPGEKFVRVEWLVGVERHRLHVLVVIVFQAAAMVVVTIAMIVMMMAMVMLVLVGGEEFRLDIEDAVEVEGVAAEHLVEPDLRPLGTVQLGVRIDAADARFQFLQLRGRDQIGLVDQDDVGKGDLVLGLGRVLEPVLQPFGVGDGDDRV